MKYGKRFKITDLLIGIVFAFFLLSISVVLTINFRPLYYLDINWLNIEETSGYPKEEIKDNYDALIDYSSPFHMGELSFPTLPSSPEGIQHFKEVKNIFTSFYAITAVTLIICLIIIFYKRKRKDYSYLPVSAITVIVFPLVAGTLLLIDFDTTFRVFHEIFFNNDYWLFDPATDPVIQILPSAFFLHCAFLIVFFVLIGCLILFCAYRHLRKHTGIRYRKNRGINL